MMHMLMMHMHTASTRTRHTCQVTDCCPHPSIHNIHPCTEDSPYESFDEDDNNDDGNEDEKVHESWRKPDSSTETKTNTKVLVIQTKKNKKLSPKN